MRSSLISPGEAFLEENEDLKEDELFEMGLGEEG